MRFSREQWRKRVEQWRGSGKPAREFADEMGFNFGTFKHWIYAIGKQGRSRPTRGKSSRANGRGKQSEPRSSGRHVLPNSLVELRPSVVMRDGRFEVELCKGRILRVPSQFDPQLLRDIVRALEGAE
jgi:hypothetical protein